MTIKEIYEQVLLDAPKIEMRNFIKRYNEVVGIIAMNFDTALAPLTDYIDATDESNLWYDLPVGCIGVNRVIDEKGRELRSYVCEKGKISFGIAGNFEIEYIGYPRQIENIENAPVNTGLHELYHLAIVKYIIAQEVPDKFEINMRMYDELTNMAHTRLKNIKRRNIRIKKPLWR